MSQPSGSIINPRGDGLSREPFRINKPQLDGFGGSNHSTYDHESGRSSMPHSGAGITNMSTKPFEGGLTMGVLVGGRQVFGEEASTWWKSMEGRYGSNNISGNSTGGLTDCGFKSSQDHLEIGSNPFMYVNEGKPYDKRDKDRSLGVDHETVQGVAGGDDFERFRNQMVETGGFGDNNIRISSGNVGSNLF
jgi:hypothetical protein